MPGFILKFTRKTAGKRPKGNIASTLASKSNHWFFANDRLIRMLGSERYCKNLDID